MDGIRGFRGNGLGCPYLTIGTCFTTCPLNEVVQIRYNVKVTDYPDNVQVNYYEYKIKRGEEDETTNISDKYIVGNSIQKSWYNSTTGKMEVIPKGYDVRIDEFTGEEYLFQVKSDDELEQERIINVFRSLRRTKQNIYEIARGSVWDLFITLTIADCSVRFDLDKSKKYICKRLNNIKSRYCKDLKYIIIFEKHPTSGAYHCHGLIKGIEGLTLNKAFNPHTGELITKNGKQVYNIKELDCVGFSSATYVEDNNKVTKYIIKYISKDLAFEFPNKKAYLCSQGLPRGIDTFYDVDDEEDIKNVLKSKLGYSSSMTHCKYGFNIYTGGEIKYMQFKKERYND